MKKLLISLIIIIVVGVGGYFLIAHTQSPTSTYTSKPALAPSQAPTQVAIGIENMIFDSSPVTISVGSTVTWTNNDTVPHTVTSDSGSTLDSPTLAPGQSYTAIFKDPGTFYYHCKIHPTMHGEIIVTN